MNNYTLSVRQTPSFHHLFKQLTNFALLSLILLPCWGVIPDGYAGWLTNPPVYYEQAGQKKKKRAGRTASWRQWHWRAGWGYGRERLSRTGYQIGLMILLSAPLSLGAWGWGLWLLPAVDWGVAVSAVVWPWWGQSVLCRGLRQVLHRSYQLSVLMLAGMSVQQLGAQCLKDASVVSGERVPLALGGLVLRQAKGWQCSIEQTSTGSLEITFTGPHSDRWFLRYHPVDEFDRRMLLVFLRHIWTPEDTPQRPFLRQEWLAAGFETYQELISRWQSYRREGDWRRLMSRRGDGLQSWEQIGEVVDVWAGHFWWRVEETQAYLAEQGKRYSLSQVKQAGQLSGFLRVRRLLQERFQIGPEALKPKDGWLTRRLLVQMEVLLDKLEAGEGLTAEERLQMEALRAQPTALGLGQERPLEQPLPWMWRMQQVLFGWWQQVEDESVRCLHCGSTQVAQKSKTPRQKQYYDQSNQLRQVAVYRYYCKNPACHHGTFTNLPLNLVPHSPWTVQAHLWVLQSYAWGRSAYRRVAQAAGLSTATVYRWVSAWGQELLPIAALFGVVRSSGIVGVDEKWVQVPKNDKPEGKRKKWMYVYMAVDVYTYDLLHIAIYPYLTRASAHSFLLELRTKGYQPTVIITDLRQDYAPLITQIFPQARHHECIFHALKWIQQEIKAVYGANYKEEHPCAVALKEDIYAIFQCRDKRTALRRYTRVMQKRPSYVQKRPQAAAIFDTLENHWPKLVNAMGSSVIPKTNNAVELVIRRFDQHYQNFCGFETLETAQCYLAVFELVYRFTPFANYNLKDKERPPDQRIGGKCPLELAGYQVSKLPIAHIFRGRLLGWPDQSFRDLVPIV